MSARKTELHKAIERCHAAREALNELQRDGLARCMEVVQDKAGIYFERWWVLTLLSTKNENRTVNLVLFSTPHWWDVFAPISNSPEADATIAAVKALAQQPREQMARAGAA